LDHPLFTLEGKPLRQRVIHLLSDKYTVRRGGHIVFVCGGNDDQHMRPRFVAHCKNLELEFELFLPEFAIDSYFIEAHFKPFDIAKFETLIGALSHAIVIFPEAAGSFAETGYFSAKQELASKTILVMDGGLQDKDSFLSLGPQALFDRNSRFKSTIQLSYAQPDFDIVLGRIQRLKIPHTRKKLDISSTKKVSDYELFCIIHEIVSLVSVARLQDIEFMCTAIFGRKLGKERIKQLTSILLGAAYLLRHGPFGYFRANSEKGNLLEIGEGARNDFSEAKLELMDFNERHDLLNHLAPD
jgi:hypothetical protein